MRRSRWPLIVSAVLQPGAVGEVNDGLLDLFPEMIPTRTTPQSPVHHAEGDVWTHTKMVLREMVGSAAYGNADKDTRVVLFLGSLLHDIAKPTTTVIEPDGRIRQPGHSKRGAIDVRGLLWRCGAPFSIRERICPLILHHQLPYFGIKERGGLSVEYQLRKLSWECRLEDLIALARADIQGRIAADIPRILDEIELFELAADELGCLNQAYAFPDADTRYAYLRRGGQIHADSPFFEAPGPVVTFVCGLAGSGKDHWINQHYQGPVVSFDDEREDMDLPHGTGEGKVVAAVTERVRQHLRAGKSFAWNATALQSTFREQRVAIARDYGARIDFVHVEAEDEAALLEQNAARGRALPEAVIRQMCLKWEMPLPPEGREVRYVVGGEAVEYPLAVRLQG